MKKSSPGKRVRLFSDSYESESSRNVVCVSDKERSGSLESGSGLTTSAPELDSIVMVGSQINLRKEQEPKGSEAGIKEILDLISEPSRSKELSGDLGKSNPRVGMRSRPQKRSRSYPKIADSRNYKKMIECHTDFS